MLKFRKLKQKTVYDKDSKGPSISIVLFPQEVEAQAFDTSSTSNMVEVKEVDIAAEEIKQKQRKAELAEFAKAYDALSENMAVFIDLFLPHIRTTNEIPKFHREIFSILKVHDRIALAAPRGFAKSTIVTKCYPLHSALFKKHKDICIISASENLASEHLRFIKNELESNQKLMALWGDVKSEKWNETHMAITHKDGFVCNIRAKGAGGQIRGFRPDCIILDDIETDEGCESEDQRRKLKNWIFKSCLNTLMPTGKFCIIGTLIHPLSVLNDILKVPNGWMKKKYQAYIDGIEKEGYELWPAMWDHARLQHRKGEIGSWAFASEYMNNPLVDESNPIKEEYIRYWDVLPAQLSTVIVCDPAYTEDVTGDWKVAAVIGIDKNQNRYLLEYHRSHAPTGEYQDAIFNMYIKHKNTCTALGCPSGGGDREFFNGLIKAAEVRKIYAPIVELKNVFHSATGQDIRNKKHRIVAALQPLFEKGKYYIHVDHLEARDELLTIGSSQHDDLVDCLSYAENILTPVYYDSNNKVEDYDAYKEPVIIGSSASGYGIDY
jgi:hypothetical protein